MPSTKTQDNQPTFSLDSLLDCQLQMNLHSIRSMTGGSCDIVFRELLLANGSRAAVIYIEGLVDTLQLGQLIIDSLTFDYGSDPRLGLPSQIEPIPLPELLPRAILKAGNIEEHSTITETVQAMLTGLVVLLLDGYDRAFAFDMKQFPDRSISPSDAEPVVRGPRDAFTENARTNTALIRRRIHNPDLRFESHRIGRKTQTTVLVAFINGLAREHILEELRGRLKRIDIDAILESSYIEEAIQDSAMTPFPTVYHSERPDVISAELLEGKVAIIVDGTPFVLVVPALFVSFFHSPEDYYQRADIASMVRMLRFIGVFFTLLGPSFYIALTTFHQEMLPTQLIVRLVAQREGIPFPAFVEALLMEITFDILREAGVRMPRMFGSTVSFIGTLVIGQSAVEAGIVSPAMLIVVAITAISSFVIPATSMSITLRLLRFPLMILSATFGLYGMMAGIIVLTLHLCSLRSFGVPYMSPLTPFVAQDVPDTIFRAPRWMNRTRPHQIAKDVPRSTLTIPKPIANTETESGDKQS